MLSLALPPKARPLISIVLGVASAGTLASPGHALQLQQGFAGVYAPANWTFANNGANGSVNTSGAPVFIDLLGNNDGLFSIFTNYTINAAESGPVSFNWVFSGGSSASFAEFGYLLNGNFNFLTNRGGGAGGTTSFQVVAGDSFGFSINGDDGNFQGIAEISNFSAPVPGPLPLLGVGAAFGYSRRLRRRINLSTGPVSSASGSSDQL